MKTNTSLYGHLQFTYVAAVSVTMIQPMATVTRATTELHELSIHFNVNLNPKAPRMLVPTVSTVVHTAPFHSGV
jgi:hypothetical protein